MCLLPAGGIGSFTENTVHPGIQATTLVGHTAGSTLLCGIQTTLQGSACALSYLQPPTGTSDAPGPSVWLPGPSAPLRRRPEAHACPGTNGVAPSRACVHSRYMHMARDYAAPPAHSEYNLVGGGRNPASCPIPMWQSNGAHARYLLELVIHYNDLVSISLCA